MLYILCQPTQGFKSHLKATQYKALTSIYAMICSLTLHMPVEIVFRKRKEKKTAHTFIIPWNCGRASAVLVQIVEQSTLPLKASH